MMVVFSLICLGFGRLCIIMVMGCCVVFSVCVGVFGLMFIRFDIVCVGMLFSMMVSLFCCLNSFVKVWYCCEIGRVMRIIVVVSFGNSVSYRGVCRRFRMISSRKRVVIVI